MKLLKKLFEIRDKKKKEKTTVRVRDLGRIQGYGPRRRAVDTSSGKTIYFNDPSYIFLLDDLEPIDINRLSTSQIMNAGTWGLDSGSVSTCGGATTCRYNDGSVETSFSGGGSGFSGGGDSGGIFGGGGFD